MVTKRKPVKLGEEKKQLKTCSLCQKKKSVARFYDSSNPFHVDGKIPFCSGCILAKCYDAEKDELILSEFKKILKEVNKPFCEDIWMKLIDKYRKAAEANPTSIFSKKSYVIYEYFKKMNTRVYKNMTWEDGLKYNLEHPINKIFENPAIATISSFDEQTDKQNLEKLHNEASDETVSMKSRSYLVNKHYLKSTGFEVTPDLLHLYGEGYTTQEYEVMDRIYNNIKDDYPNISNNQRQLLIRYVRLAAKEEIATSYGVLAEAEKWAKLANEALKQLNSSDVQGGITSFSEFFQKIEREKDIIPILPRFKYRPNDAPDFIIWCFVNYCRRLEGKSQCSYEDIYKFYDEKKNEYIKETGDPYGVFKDDPAVQNRDKIKNFIKLPADFYMNDDDYEITGGEDSDL